MEEYSYEKIYQCSPITECKNFTKLMYMIIMNIPIDSYIKDNKEEINKKNEGGWTALMIASRNSRINNNMHNVEILLRSGADPNLHTNNGWTALMLASRISNIDSNIQTVKMLLESEAKPNLKDNNGWTALMLASKYSNTDSNIQTVEMLLRSGANPNLKDNNGYTALMLASRYSNNIKAIELLLTYGSDINLTNNHNQSCIDYLNDNGNLKKILNIINQITHYKLCMNVILKHIKRIYYQYTMKPTGLTTKLINLDADIVFNKKSYHDLKETNYVIFNYFGIYDDDSLHSKVIENMKLWKVIEKLN